MKFNSIFRLPQYALVAVRASVFALLAGALVACGGGGVTSTAPPAEAVFIKEPRALPAEYLARKAVAYSPYRTATSAANRDAEVITATMVKEDLDLLIQGNFKLIRLFDSSDKVAKLVLDVIVDNNMDMKVQLGAYVNSFKYETNPYKAAATEAANMAELNRAIALATNATYRNIVLAVSVGNETLVNWSIVPVDIADMVRYIKHVRPLITQPVTTDDNFLAFANPAPKAVINEIDFVAIHLYPNIDTQFPDGDLYWDWKQLAFTAGPARATAMMNASMVALRQQYQMVRVALDSMGLHAMPIAITETGWNAVDKGAQKFRAHPVNQKMFYQRLETFRAEGRVGAGPANVFYFEAFDEPWKQGDDGWGLFNVARKARYVVQNLYPTGIWENAALTDADAVYFTPPTIKPAVSAAQFVLYSDASGLTPASGLRVDAFDGNSVNAPEVTTAPAPAPEGAKNIEISPQPKNYGWGLLWQPTASGDTNNLSEFAASGSLKLLVKTTYAGKIEVGLSTLTEEGNTQEVYIQIGNGDYGYCNTGAWCQVSIPLQAFKTKNPKIDFRFVISPFIISDRYEFTGKPLNSNITTKLNIDGIYWSR